MGVMGKFRDNTGVVLWILIGSFGLLWVVMDVFDPNALMSGPRSMGTVNGESISFEEYNGLVQSYTNAYSQQTGSSMSSELRSYYESQAWEELVRAKLITQKMDELGITVTDDELRAMAYGDNPDPLILQYFGRPDGTFDRFAVENFFTGNEFQQEKIAIEQQLREKRRQDKLRTFITAGLQVTDQDIQNEFTKRNTFAEVSFVRFPYSEVEESELSVTDAELRAYYDKNKELYKREESYRAKFVSFSTLPTSADTAAIIEEVLRESDRFVETDNDSTFLINVQSTTPYTNVFVNKDEIREEYAPVLEVGVGEVTDIINFGASVGIIKKVAETGSEVKFAVLTKVIEALPATIDDAAEQADEFEYFATEESSFDEEATRGGLDVAEVFATKGNTFVSGLGSSQQVLDFFSKSDEGDISKPIELATQFVVVILEDKTDEGYRPIEEVKAQVEAQVKNEKRKELTVAKVEGMLASNTTVEGLSQAAGMEAMEANLNAGSLVLTGAGREPGVIGSIFAMQSGQTSSVIEGDNGAYVVQINSISEPTATGLDQATASTIRQELEQKLSERYLTIWLDELKGEADITDNRSRLIQ